MVHTVVVRGTPRSIQSSSRSKTARKRIVANEASRAFNSPLVDDGLKITITIFYNGFPTWDPNNMAKPICDAMNGIAYIDDNQVTDHFVKKRPLDGSYRIKGIPLEN